MKKESIKKSTIPILLLFVSNFLYSQIKPNNLSSIKIIESKTYLQSFDEIKGGIYPSGWGAWNVVASAVKTGTNPRVIEVNIKDSDIAKLNMGGGANTTLASVYTFNKAIGFKNGNQTDYGIYTALNTEGIPNNRRVNVSFDAMIMRNLLGGDGGDLILALALQYRIGDTGSFINLGETIRNGEFQKTSGNEPAASNRFSFELPEVCSNKSIVHLRWITKYISGSYPVSSNNIPSFAIDNFEVVVKAPAPEKEPSLLKMKLKDNYLNIPVSMAGNIKKLDIKIGGKTVRSFEARFTNEKPDYWIFTDVSQFKGKDIEVSSSSVDDNLTKIYQSGKIAGIDSMYKEKNRPQVHYTSMRGWLNDPNGLVYHDGEYHLFYQHYPYDTRWTEIHWGHAVSKDLIHWRELPVALYPDEGGMIFSGSAVVDNNNTAGFNKNNKPSMVVFYTSWNRKDIQTQCMAYSSDDGRTWTKYDQNPILNSGEKLNTVQTRDPKVFWHEPSKKWVMVLYEKDGLSIYNSGNLKNWNYQSHIAGFYECPELYELPVDGNIKNKKWVMSGGSGVYMVGNFDGKVFIPESERLNYVKGTSYGGQTFNNMEDPNRRVQISWGKGINTKGSPFNQQMMFPTELTLRTTRSGVRLYSYPVKEIEKLYDQKHVYKNITQNEANTILKKFNNESPLRLKFKLASRITTTQAGTFSLNGQDLLKVDLRNSFVNDVFYSPSDPTSLEIDVDIIIDKASIETFIDGGAFSFYNQKLMKNEEGFRFHSWTGGLEIKDMYIYTLKSIWEE
ncbi:glycoside hydrolase family 32 protein [Pseudopedobacter beijingensis]|uniref:Glycoside hydrolase family 32 protein n=1 Tax=Pseudopedobacter beijingensis TaxID=1207056 RepID=A0ABW4IGA4_9SPHI